MKKELEKVYGDLGNRSKLPKWLYNRLGEIKPKAIFKGYKWMTMPFYIVVYHNGLVARYFDTHIKKNEVFMKSCHPELLNEPAWDIEEN